MLEEYELYEAEYGDEPVDNINRPMQRNDQEMQVDNVPLIDSEGDEKSDVAGDAFNDLFPDLQKNEYSSL